VCQEWQSASINHVLPIDVIFCQYKWYFANKSYILQSCSVEICSLTVNFVLFCRSALLCRFNIPPNTSSWYQNIISSRATHWYDTRCYFNVRSKADISQLNLPHGISYCMLLLHDTMLKNNDFRSGTSASPLCVVTVVHRDKLQNIFFSTVASTWSTEMIWFLNCNWSAPQNITNPFPSLTIYFYRHRRINSASIRMQW